MYSDSIEGRSEVFGVSELIIEDRPLNHDISSSNGVII